MNKYVDHYVLAAMIDGMIKNGKPHLVEAVWSKIVRNHKSFKVDTNCLSLCLLAAHRSNNEQLVEKYANLMMKRMDCLKVTDWNKIFTAYGSMANYGQMWLAYSAMLQFTTPSIQSLCILCTLEERRTHKEFALNEAVKYISNWSELKVSNYGELKGIYRIAVAVQHNRLCNLLSDLLKEERFEDVVTKVGDRSFNNLYKRESKFILALVDSLIERVAHKVDVSNHPEVKSDANILKMISYHSEKKALAYLLHQNESNHISMTVNMRMCTDCHNLFAAVSWQYPNKNIVCIDPKIKHRFKNGKCSCGKNR